MKEEKTKKKKILYYLVLAISVLLLTAATVLTVYFVTGNKSDIIEQDPSTPVGPNEPDEPDKPTGGDKETYCLPIQSEGVTVFNDIYKSQTTGFIYRHQGVDFAAEEGAKVASIADGKIEKISLSKQTGNLIVVDHGNGLKGYYRFVEPDASLKEGASITKGQYFASVAAAYGSEAADGTHLHLELTLNGKKVDPAGMLDIQYDEK